VTPVNEPTIEQIVYISLMKTLEIHVPEDVAAKIEQAAEHKGVSLDELIRLSVEEKFARDDEFARATRHVLTKNAELYERLA
jgi:Ribbon-helix-helix protein, copG family